MSLSFGTDGIRGVANVDLTVELVTALGRAAARVFRKAGESNTWLIGRDTRRSGPLLQAALSAGLASEGSEVVDLGVLPTPGVAFHAQRLNAPAAMISASHNPFEDNGIKFFAAGGRKLPDAIEAELEAELAKCLHDDAVEPPKVGPSVGTMRRAAHAGDDYVERIATLLGGSKELEGMTIVLDCANGAASAVGPQVFERLGATVHVLHASPDGVNINTNCGSTHPEDLQAAVVSLGAHLGLAFDGDADRLIAVDQLGQIVDGDRVIALCALDRKSRKVLAQDTVVVTVMTNLGFRIAMQKAGIKIVETKVGDRYVLEALEAQSLNLGGEQSGHVIFRDVATTGDGVLTGAYLASLVVRNGNDLHQLANEVMDWVPQVLLNVRVANRAGLADAQQIWNEVKTVEAELGDTGRVLLRPSGTEPVVRVMVEATGDGVAQAAAERLKDVLLSELGRP